MPCSARPDEASAFVVRHIIDLAGVEVTRIVATGGGVRNPAWLQALADGTSLPVDVVAVPEGAALGHGLVGPSVGGPRGAGRQRRLDGPAPRRASSPTRSGPRPQRTRYVRFRELAG